MHSKPSFINNPTTRKLSENNSNKVSNSDKYSFNTYSSVAALNDVLKEKQYSDLTI